MLSLKRITNGIDARASQSDIVTCGKDSANKRQRLGRNPDDDISQALKQGDLLDQIMKYWKSSVTRKLFIPKSNETAHQALCQRIGVLESALRDRAIDFFGRHTHSCWKCCRRVRLGRNAVYRVQRPFAIVRVNSTTKVHGLLNFGVVRIFAMEKCFHIHPSSG
jgi:hypothetical protein